MVVFVAWKAFGTYPVCHGRSLKGHSATQQAVHRATSRTFEEPVVVLSPSELPETLPVDLVFARAKNQNTPITRLGLFQAERRTSMTTFIFTQFYDIDIIVTYDST